MYIMKLLSYTVTPFKFADIKVHRLILQFPIKSIFMVSYTNVVFF